MSERLFGTDGIRGRAGEGPLVPEFLRRIGHALGERVGHSARVVIGHDGRASGPGIVHALAEGLAAAGCLAEEIGLCTTPSLAFVAGSGPYLAGVMVSASHNPAEDNGVKLFGPDGAKLPDAAELELEQALRRTSPDLPAGRGAIEAHPEALDGYRRWLREHFADLDLRGRRILADCANGGASRLAREVLTSFGAEAICINDAPDGGNINQGCGALHPEQAARAAVARACELGVCLDGDADRGLLVDGDGRVLDGDTLLAGLGAHAMARNELPQHAVVATVMSNLALENWLAARGARLIRTQVGDRFVAEAMRAGRYGLGGEKSGHLLFGADHGWRGDGLYTLLRVLRALQRDNAVAGDFAREYADWPQRLVNLRVTRRVPLEELPQLAAAVRALEQKLDGSGRTVVRFSGTELKLRLMVEAQHDADVESALALLEGAARADGIVTG